MARRLKILYVTSEAHPYAKTGGLADVSGALPKALRKLGHDVRLILPKYKCVPASKIRPMGKKIPVLLGSTYQEAILFEAVQPGPTYFIGHDPFFDRDGLYGSGGQDFPDNAERFIFFCRAILETCKAIHFQPDIIHCSDWQTGLVPAYLKSIYAAEAFFKNTRSIFSIHNLGYAGNFSPQALHTAHLPWTLFHPKGVEFFGQFSFLKAGLVHADLLNTVSKKYSREILKPENGFGFEGILQQRRKDLFGVLNGVDEEAWDPAEDPLIDHHFNARSLTGKQACKRDLVQSSSIELGRREPLICMITRLSEQKGLDLIVQGFPEIMAEKAAFILLGSGDTKYEKFFKSQKYPNKFVCRLGFDEKLAHRILAGSDILLMPSRYEPCGLTQMYGMRYGAVPVVRAVGGLADTVPPFNIKTGQGTGFNFRPFELKYFMTSLRQALTVYNQPKIWRQLIRNGMSQDHGWEKVAGQYTRLYHRALRQK